jgi:sec-independent protein translocase protein TatA
VYRNPLVDAIVVLVVVLLIFGPKRLPLLGKGLREFKESITGGSHGEEEAERPALTSAGTPPPVGQSQSPEAEASEPRA